MFIYFSKWFLQHGTWSLKAAQDGEVLLFPCSLASSTSPKRLQSNETKCRPRQSFLSFQSYKYKVPCLSCPFCTLLEKSTVWKVQYSVLCLNWKDLKASANVYTAFYNLQICTGSGKQLMKPLCKMSHLVLFLDAPWQELPLLLHCLFAFFCQRKIWGNNSHISCRGRVFGGILNFSCQQTIPALSLHACK